MYTWKHKIPQVTKAILSRKKSNVEKIIMPTSLKLHILQNHSNKNNVALSGWRLLSPFIGYGANVQHALKISVSVNDEFSKFTL